MIERHAYTLDANRPQAVALTATASDPDGRVSRVEFFQGSTLIGTATQEPWARHFRMYSYVTGELGVPPERLILWGRSVGGGPSVHLASRHPVAGMVLEATFSPP